MLYEPSQSYEVSIVIPILCMGKLKLRETKRLAKIPLIPESMPFTLYQRDAS